MRATLSCKCERVYVKAYVYERVSACMNACMCKYVLLYARAVMCVCLRLFVCVRRVYVCVCAYMYAHVFMYECVCVCFNMCMHVFASVCARA